MIKTNFRILLKIFKGAIFPAICLLPPNGARGESEPSSPMVRIAKIHDAPSIDGRDEDKAWKKAVAVTEFLVLGTRAPASEATSARLCFDDRNLYAFIRCDEPILSNAEQRQHEIKAQAVRRDEEGILNDDCLLLFVQPDGGKSVFELAINSRGILYDAKADSKALWESRDSKWNAKATVSARQQDGFWTVEIAIPWEALGCPPPGMDSAWRLGLARNAAARGEISSWHFAGSSLHESSEAFGELSFGKDLPGVTPVKPWNHPETGRFEFELTGPAGQAGRFQSGSIVLEMEAGSSKIADRKEFHLEKGSDQIVFEVAPLEVSAARIRWSAFGADAGDLLYRSPSINLKISNSKAVLRFTTQKEYEVLLNGTTVESGSSGVTAKEVPLRLRNGRNLVELATEGGQAEITLEPPGAQPAWRMLPVASKQPLERSSGTPAKSGAGQPIGKPGSPTRLAHTLYTPAQRIIPIQYPALYIAEGTIQAMWMWATGFPERKLDDWELVLLIPPEFELAGVSGFYGSEEKPAFSWRQAGERGPSGEAIYRIKANRPVLNHSKSRHPLHQLAWIGLKTSARNKPETGRPYRLKYWVEADGGSTTELPGEQILEAMPALKGRQPSKLAVQLWQTEGFSMDDTPLYGTLLQTPVQAGFTEYVVGASNRYRNETANLKKVSRIGFEGYSLKLSTILDRDPDSVLIATTGKPRPPYICTTRLLDRHWPTVDTEVRNFVESAGSQSLIYDYEFTPAAGPHSCYCALCLGHFKEFADLPTETFLDGATIQKEYSGQWMAFMTRRVAQVCQKLKASANSAGVPFQVYSGYQSSRTAQRYGVDWKEIAKFKAADAVGCGYGRPVPAISATVEALGDIPARYGILLHPSRLGQEGKISQQATKAPVLRRFLDSSGGILVYESSAADGRTWTAFAEVTRLIAEYEELFLKRAAGLLSLPGVDILQGGGTSLAILCNDTGKAKSWDFRLPEKLGAGREFYTGESVARGSRIEMTIPAGEVRVFVFKD